MFAIKADVSDTLKVLEYLESVNIWNKWIFGINTVNTVFLNTNLLATDSSLPSVNSIHLVSDDTPSWKQEQNRNLSYSFYNQTTMKLCEIINFCQSIIFCGLCRLAESLKYSYKLQLLSSTLYILSSTNRSPWENCNYRRITNVNDHEYDYQNINNFTARDKFKNNNTHKNKTKINLKSSNVN